MMSSHQKEKPQARLVRPGGMPPGGMGGMEEY
jgi:hypothetical protein